MAECDLLIVGANGFLGARTVAAAVAAGRAVATFGPPSPGRDLLAPWRDRIREISGSMTEAADVMAALSGSRPRAVLCFAAHGEGRGGLMRAGEDAPDRAFAMNVAGFRTLLATCAAAGVPRVLWASSTTVFGPADAYGPVPVDETAPCAPRSIYGLTKQLAETVAQFYRQRTGMEICAVRPPLVFGPGRWYGGAAERLDILLGAAARRERLALRVPEERFDLMHGDDVAAAFLHLAAHRGALAPCYHVNGFVTSYRGIAAVLMQECPGFHPVLEFVPSEIVYPLISAGRVAHETGFQPRLNLRAALLATLQENPP